MFRSLRVRYASIQKLTEDEKTYVLTKGCTCNACTGFNAGFLKNCSSHRLEVLNRMPKETQWQS